MDKNEIIQKALTGISEVIGKELAKTLAGAVSTDADKEAAEKVAKEKADKEAADLVAKEKADKEAAEKLAKEGKDKMENAELTKKIEELTGIVGTLAKRISDEDAAKKAKEDADKIAKANADLVEKTVKEVTEKIKAELSGEKKVSKGQLDSSEVTDETIEALVKDNAEEDVIEAPNALSNEYSKNGVQLTNKQVHLRKKLGQFMVSTMQKAHIARGGEVHANDNDEE